MFSTSQPGEQEIPDQRLPAINAPQKSRDALGVSAGNQRWVFFRGGCNFSCCAAADQVKKALTHRIQTSIGTHGLDVSVSATEAASTVGFDPSVTEPGLVQLE